MMGPPRNWLSRFYGPSGLCIQLIWRFIAPVLLAVCQFITYILNHIPVFSHLFH